MQTKTGKKNLSNSFFRSQYEKYSFLTATSLLALATFVYGVARVLKDAFVVPAGGGEMVGNLKVWWVLPSMMFFGFVYSKMGSIRLKDRRYIFVLLYFFAFFALFAFVLYPNDAKCKAVFAFLDKWPIFHKEGALYYVGLMFKLWHLTFFYVHSEAIGTFVLSVLAWGYINTIISPEQAKRHYAYLNVGSAVATFLAGIISMYWSDEAYRMYLVVLMLIGFAAILVVYYTFAQYAKRNPELLPVASGKKKRKQKRSFKESIREFLVGENAFYVCLILVFVLCFAWCTPLFESLHKNFLKAVEMNGMENAVHYYSAMQLMLTGVFSAFVVLVIVPLVNKLSWRFKAWVTPVIFLVGTILYVVVLRYKSELLEFVTERFGVDISSEKMLVFIGIGALVAIKGLKYVFNDAAREQAYTLLDTDTKEKAKTVIDGVGSRFGKSGGAAFISFISTLTVPLGTSSKVFYYRNVILSIVIVVLILWIVSISFLSKEYNARYDAQVGEKDAVKASSHKAVAATKKKAEPVQETAAPNKKETGPVKKAPAKKPAAPKKKKD